jgi:hypothetical protein
MATPKKKTATTRKKAPAKKAPAKKAAPIPIHPLVTRVIPPSDAAGKYLHKHKGGIKSKIVAEKVFDILSAALDSGHGWLYEQKADAKADGDTEYVKMMTSAIREVVLLKRRLWNYTSL